MKRFATHTIIGLTLGLGLTLASLWLLSGRSSTVRADPGNLLFVKPQSRWGTCTMDQPCPLQTAINKAVDGDTIYLAGGTYTSNGEAVATLTKTVKLYGGWDGKVAKEPEYDPDTYHTILDGEGQRRGIDISGNCTPTLDGLRITNGYAGISGGAGIDSELAHPIINHCHVFSNTASDDGGGIYLGQADYAQLMGNTIYSNTAGAGGGIYITGSEDIVLADNDVYLNTAANTGGGIYIMGNTDVTLRNNWIYGNQADIAGGGVLLFQVYDANLINNMVVNNHIFPPPGQGAGIAMQNTTAHFLHTTIALNAGANTQGVYVVGIPSVAWMTNTILAGHSTGIETSGGGAVTMTHTLWGSGMWANGIDTVGNNIYTGTVNIWEDPLFADPLIGDFHLTFDSPAIDAGTDAGVTTDIDGETRIGAFDLGADEFVAHVYLPLILR